MKAVLHRLGLTVLLLSGLPGSLLAAEPAAPAENPARNESTPEQKRYLFEHMVLPRWTHEENAAFPAHLLAGRSEGLVAAARDIVGEEYAQGLRVRQLESPAGALILLPKPQAVPQCHAIAVITAGAGYRYFTLEMTEDYLGDGSKTCLCEWQKGGDEPKHANFGPRPYDDVEKFLAEVQQILAKSTAPIPTVK
jgi:hypothetical protein